MNVLLSNWSFWIALAYVVGSIPFGVLIGRARGVDIRAHGSRNIGATNVARVLGKPLGLICFALDLAKGAGPVVGAGVAMNVIGRDVADLTTSQQWAWLGVGSAAILGHVFSVFLGFRGGKGVATSFGAMLAMWPLLTYGAIGALVVWYLALRVTRYVSVASMSAAASLPLAYLLSVIPSHAAQQPMLTTLTTILHAFPPFILTLALAFLVLYLHRGNIARLRRGEEPQVSDATRRGGLPERGKTPPTPPTTAQ